MKNTRFEMRFDTDTLQRLEAWRREQPDLPSRAESVRRLVNAGIATLGERRDVRLSDGEKLILWMLRDLFLQHRVEGEIDPEFVCAVISGGHYWALDWEFPGLTGRPIDRELVSEVIDVLNMWTYIERGYENLSNTDKERVKLESSGRRPIFMGFYANEEIEHLSVTRFLIDHLKKFRWFEERELDSHLPTIDAYRRMLAAFRPLQKELTFDTLSASQVIDLLKERIHPENRRD